MGLTSRIDVEHAAERHEKRSHAGAWERGVPFGGRQPLNAQAKPPRPIQCQTKIRRIRWSEPDRWQDRLSRLFSRHPLSPYAVRWRQGDGSKGGLRNLPPFASMSRRSLDQRPFHFSDSTSREAAWLLPSIFHSSVWHRLGESLARPGKNQPSPEPPQIVLDLVARGGKMGRLY
jgi:hypothetical protein